MTSTYRYTTILMTVVIVAIFACFTLGIVALDYYGQIDLSFVLFEDGSFLLNGCQPWSICN